MKRMTFEGFCGWLTSTFSAQVALDAFRSVQNHIGQGKEFNLVFGQNLSDSHEAYIVTIFGSEIFVHKMTEEEVNWAGQPQTDLNVHSIKRQIRPINPSICPVILDQPEQPTPGDVLDLRSKIRVEIPFHTAFVHDFGQTYALLIMSYALPEGNIHRSAIIEQSELVGSGTITAEFTAIDEHPKCKIIPIAGFWLAVGTDVAHCMRISTISPAVFRGFCKS